MRLLTKVAVVAAMSVACVAVAAPATAAPAPGSAGAASGTLTAEATWQRVGFYEDYLSCEAVGIWDVFWGNAYAYDCESNPGHGWTLYELI